MKKHLTGLAAVLSCALVFTACGSAQSAASTASQAAASEATTSVAETTSATGERITLKVGASPAPHAAILEAAQPLLAERGIDLEIVTFDDYVLPNTALAEGDLDANYFQHQPYLTAFNEGNGTDIVSAGSIHYEPLGIYPGKATGVDALEDGAQIAVPNDGSNEARALYLLEAQGLITVNHDAGFTATVLDITDNPKNLEIVEIDADKIPNQLADVALGVINGNYAIGAGINDTVLATEDAAGESAQTYANIVAVRNGDESRPEIQALVEVLQGAEIKAFIEETYKGSVVPLG